MPTICFFVIAEVFVSISSVPTQAVEPSIQAAVVWIAVVVSVGAVDPFVSVCGFVRPVALAGVHFAGIFLTAPAPIAGPAGFVGPVVISVSVIITGESTEEGQNQNDDEDYKKR